MKVYFQGLFIGLFLCLLPYSWSTQQDRLFYDAVRAEASGDLDLAIQIYLKTAKISHSSNLHGNLANLYFKKEQFGRSILHFEKALLLDPKNSELSANLNFAYEMANTSPKNKNLTSIYFSSNFLSFWIVISAIIFWVGLITLSYLLFYSTNKKLVFYLFPMWICLSVLSVYSSSLSLSEQNKLNRTVIVFEPDSEHNKAKKVPLRRFAGEPNSANTTVISGENLLIDFDDIGNPKSHKVLDGKTWYLARSKDGRKKGWIRENEFGWILDP